MYVAKYVLVYIEVGMMYVSTGPLLWYAVGWLSHLTSLDVAGTM